jgi:hypothetical protein
VTKVAFVIGNGVSRQSININLLIEQGAVYGCNALYRDITPHHLIAVDIKMIKEIVETGYHLKNSVWTNPNAYSKTIENLCIFNPNLGWSSGPSALNLATQHGFKQIYILGFDYEGIGTNKEYVNNIYANSHNYKKINDNATYYGNWVRQTTTIIQKNPEVKYIRVIKDHTSFIPDSLRIRPNLQQITTIDFKNLFKC